MKVKIRGLVFAGFAAAVFAQSAMAQTDDNTVTSKTYVDTKFQAQAKRVEIGNGTGQYASVSAIPETVKTNEYYPSMKVLSDTVLDGNFQRKLTADEKGPHIGIIVDRGTNGEHDYQSEWQEIGGSTYVSVGSNTGGTAISVGLNDGKIANAAAVIAGSNGQGPASTDEDDLTTAKAVYDFVVGDTTGGFQPKTHVGTGETANTLKVGKGEGEWGVFQAYDDTAVGNTEVGYLEITDATSRGVYEINIDSDMIARNGATNGNINNDIVDNSNKLTTANAVYEYAVPYQWNSSTQANKTLVTDSTGRVTVSTVPTLPEFGDTDPCKAAGVHCALVTNYDTQSGEISFEWTTMAITQ